MFLKGNQPLTSFMEEDGEPRERLWGLRLLQQRAGGAIEFRATAGRIEPLHRRLVDRIRPFPSVCGCRPSDSLIQTFRSIEQHDTVLSLSQEATASLLYWRHGRTGGPRVVCLALGMADRLVGMTVREQRRSVELLSNADSLLAMSPGELEVLHGLGLTHAELLPFGVDTRFWARTEAADEAFVFAVGSDPCRDFDGLIRACPYPLRIMTLAPERLVTVPIPPNVKFVNGDTATLRDLYSRARVVVVPLKDRLQPSGQNTALQAMAIGKPLVLTRTRGLWSEHLRDGHNCLLVPSASESALRTAIRAAYEDRSLARQLGAAGRRTVEAFFPVERLVETLHRVLMPEHVPGALSSAGTH